MVLVEAVYRETSSFPRGENYGLTVQMRRCAISVPSNIAEGAARNSAREFVQFLGISCGSLSELETQIELAVRLGYLDANCNALRQLHRAGRMVRALRRAMRDKLLAGTES